MQEDLTNLRLKEYFEPILELDETYIFGAVFRETPNLFHYVCFHIWAALFTRNYYLVLTSKRVMLTSFFFPKPLINYEKIAFVEYESIEVDTNSMRLLLKIRGRSKPLVLKFAFHTNMLVREIILTRLNQKIQEKLISS